MVHCCSKNPRSEEVNTVKVRYVDPSADKEGGEG